MLKTALPAVILAGLLAGCAGVQPRHMAVAQDGAPAPAPAPHRQGASALAGAAAATRATANPGAVAAAGHRVAPHETANVAHHRIPSSITNDPPEVPRELPPLEPGKAPIEARFNIFPFKIRRRERKSRPGK